MYQEILEHHGIKGQKWGKRKKIGNADKYFTRQDKGKEGKKAKTKKMDKLDAKYSDQVRNKHHVAAYNYAAKKMNEGGIAKINNSPKYKGKDLSKNKKLQKDYWNDYVKAMDKHLNQASKEVVGTSASGRYSTKFYADPESGFPRYKIVDNRKVKHSIDDHYLEPEIDETGHFVSFKYVNEDIRHSIDLNDILEHHGVKGQKWGKRKKGGAVRKITGAYNLNKASKAREQKFITGYKKRGTKTNAQLKKELERLRLETEYKNLTQQLVSSNAKTRASRIQTAKTAFDLATKGYDTYKKTRKALGHSALSLNVEDILEHHGGKRKK